MTFHTQVVGANGQRQAMFIERCSGLAEAILANFDLGPPDVMIVYSHSGTNRVPIEVATGARARGLPVIAVTSLAHGDAVRGQVEEQLRDHADVVLDLATPPGDALVTVPGFPAPVGPGSSLTGVALSNSIKARTAELLAERGLKLPVIASGAVVGDEADAQVEAAYREHARRARRALRA